MLLVFETSKGPGTERVWSTFDSVNYLMGNKLAPVDISASEQDVNSDGKVDLIDIKAVVRGVGDVNGVKALMAFDYSLGGRVDLVMNSMAYAAHSSPLAGSGLYVDGYLRLDQRDAIPLVSPATTTTTASSRLRSTVRLRVTRAMRRRCVCLWCSISTISATSRPTSTRRPRCGNLETPGLHIQRA